LVDDTLGHDAGDEFPILLNDLRTAEDAVRVAERLLNTLAPGYRIFEHEVHSMASVGIVTSGQCTGNAEEVIRNADVAMYEAKRAGRGCSVLCSEAMHERMTRHRVIEPRCDARWGPMRVSLVRNLGQLSVAAGVDEAAQVAILQSLGCDGAAGPSFAGGALQPVPEESSL
jgi:predicted signal transduction protein with EAL and GGDEF domain